MSEINYATASKQYRQGEYLESLSTLNRLIDSNRDARTFSLLAKTLQRLNMNEEAARAFQLAADLNGANAEEYLAEAIKLYYQANNHDLALALANKIVGKTCKQPDLAFAIASILHKRQQNRLARPYVETLMKSRNVEYMRLGAHIILHTWDVFDPRDIKLTGLMLEQLPKSNPIRLMHLVFCREHSKFDSMDRHQPIIDAAIAAGDDEFVSRDGTFFNLHWTANERLNQMARSNTPAFSPEMTARRRKLPHQWSDKIRLGYVSSDFFSRHATMKLIRQVLERHDRNKFEVTLFCHTPEDLLAKETTDRSVWGEIVTIRDMTNEQAREEIRRRNIDILIDLKGHTVDNRTAIFNLGCAPIQVGWLGFPGSTVNVDLDYAIGDSYVLPDSSAPYYYEKFCRMPETYQPNDPVNRPLPQRAERSELGLPEDAFVFASFNGNRKLTSRMLGMWAEILKRTPNSVIWILRGNNTSEQNIRKHLKSLGVADNRIFFTGKIDFQLHLNRIPTADLGLDTFPVNGHTTTSEQLWAGLPVLTVKGSNFASRVSESLLNAIGLPECVVADEREYVEKAVELASNPHMLKPLRDRLEANRFTKPLFDDERFCRHLETAYQMMVDRARSGKAPENFDVPALPPRTGAFMEK